MNPTIDTKAQTFLQNMAVSNPGAASATLKRLTSGNSYAPMDLSNVESTINTATLGQNQPMRLATIPTSTTAAGFGAELTGNINAEVQQADALQAQTDAKASEAEKSLNKSTSALSKFLGIKEGASSVADQAYKETNEAGISVDTAGKKLKDVNNRINAIDIGTNEQIKRLEGAGGLTTGQLQNQIGAIQRKSSSQKADLYIEKLMAQGDYDSAKGIADRKIDMVLEQQENDYAKLKFDYEENKDLFSKAEQRAFELAQNDREYELSTERDRLKTFENTKIDLQRSANEQGAPQYIKDAISRATTTDEAIKAAGVFGGDILAQEVKKSALATDRLQRAKIQSDIDANAGIGVQYTPKQLTALTKLNQDVSKNATYTKTTSMRNYGDNVLASLDLGSGVGDISAINQFQN